MDLSSIDRREKRKKVLAWVFIPTAIMTFIILWTSAEEDGNFIEYVERCVEVLENKHNYNPMDVEQCRKVIQEIIRSQDTFGKLQT
jgi:hypothetical protein